MILHRIGLFFLILSFKPGSAQEIAGVWTGNSANHLLVAKPAKIVVELELYNDSLLTGVSHLYYSKGRYEHYKLKGKYKRSDSTLEFREDSMIAFKYKGALPCMGTYAMKLTVQDNRLLLNGIWKDNKRGIFSCPTLKTWFQKENNPGDTSNLAYKTRFSDIQKIIEIDSVEQDSIKIELFDNGVEDDDTVSIYLDDKEILTRRRISGKPISFYVNLNKSLPITKIKMVADNVGTIPPNTAVLIITTKRNQYNVHLSSDFQKNAVVEFFLRD